MIKSRDISLPSIQSVILSAILACGIFFRLLIFQSSLIFNILNVMSIVIFCLLIPVFLFMTLSHVFVFSYSLAVSSYLNLSGFIALFSLKLIKSISKTFDNVSSFTTIFALIMASHIFLFFYSLMYWKWHGVLEKTVISLLLLNSPRLLSTHISVSSLEIN